MVVQGFTFKIVKATVNPTFIIASCFCLKVCMSKMFKYDLGFCDINSKNYHKIEFYYDTCTPCPMIKLMKNYQLFIFW